MFLGGLQFWPPYLSQKTWWDGVPYFPGMSMGTSPAYLKGGDGRMEGWKDGRMEGWNAGLEVDVSNKNCEPFPRKNPHRHATFQGFEQLWALPIKPSSVIKRSLAAWHANGQKRCHDFSTNQKKIKKKLISTFSNHTRVIPEILEKLWLLLETFKDEWFLPSLIQKKRHI